MALAFLLGRSLARPIQRLAQAAEAVSNFDFTGAMRIGASPFREIDAASRAWDAMLQALAGFETYVPKQLVSRLMRASPGTGIIAGKTVRSVLESVGVKDVLSKSLGSKNAANVVKATLDALRQLRLKEEIYKSRGLVVEQPQVPPAAPAEVAPAAAITA